MYCHFKDVPQLTETYFKCDGSDEKLKNTCESESTDNSIGTDNSCKRLGLERVSWNDNDQKMWAETKYGSEFIPDDHVTSNKYLCSTNDQSTVNGATNDQSIHWNKVADMYEDGVQDAHGHVTNAKADAHLFISQGPGGAEPGKYVIRYEVEDAQGNQQCRDDVLRTVIVRDTLPPVITLHLLPEKALSADQPLSQDNERDTQPDEAGGYIIHTGDTGQKGLGSGGSEQNTNNIQTQSKNGNPTFKFFNGDSFMAEDVAKSSNVWAMAAAASAVTGLALLGFSRRTQVATSVPV